LRFLEVNGYLPSHVRVFTDENNTFKPQILTEAINLELDGLDMDKVYALKDANDNDTLFKYLVITQCNALNPILPGMFQRLSDYTELLFPDNLLREGSAIEQMIALIPEDDWRDAVQIIGWLYQYYNVEPKAKVFGRPAGTKIKKEEVPAATQLFTSDWIVRYMVENSLGRVWLEGHPNQDLRNKWDYYLDEPEQLPEVTKSLVNLRKQYAELEPEQIKCIDPCMGSGHVLAYMFDILIQIYEAYGYSTREAVASIVKNNIYGLDIDDRASQLAYFSMMMKARQYDRRFFSRNIQPNVYAVEESSNVDAYVVDAYCNGDKDREKAIQTIISELSDAKEYGSILKVTNQDWNDLFARFEEIEEEMSISSALVLKTLLPLVKTAQVLAQKYHAVITNPPYMASGGMSSKLYDFVCKHYPDSKYDLFSVFMERADAFALKGGFTSLITMESWMFISSFERLREIVNSRKTIINMVHMPYLGKGGTSLGINFGTAAVVMRNERIKDYTAQYEYTVYYETDSDGVPLVFPTKNERWKTATQENFSKIPGAPVAYWVSPEVCEVYKKSLVKNYMDCRSGIMTGDDKYIKLWFEVDQRNLKLDCASASDMGEYKWFPLNSGGDFRYYFGNNSKVVNLWHDGAEIIANVKNYRLRDKAYYFRKGITWGRITSSKIAFRETIDGSLFGDAGPIGFIEQHRRYLLGFLCSKVALYFLEATNPTLNYQVRDIENLPLLIDYKHYEHIENMVGKCIALAKEDWDLFEGSWDFARHPLMPNASMQPEEEDSSEFSLISECYKRWEESCKERYDALQFCEEELNRLFIQMYGLERELTPEVEERDVTVRKADLSRDIRGLISYAVGCMLGRYSLDIPGLAYAGGDWDDSRYVSFDVDGDNIIPICDDDYFKDDIVGQFIKFIEIVYGKSALEENLKFIASALGGKGSPTEIIRNYFLNEFYKDHCATYQITGSGKRPIYWMFDSGKKGGFRALVYMHRYQPDTIARMRTDYVHEQQARYRTAIADLEQRIASASTSERVKLSKRLKTLQEQAAEIQGYEEKIHHLADQYIAIDLDDGVKKNYEIFKDVLAKIK